MRNQSDLLRNSKQLVLLKILKMNNFVLLTSGKVLPTLEHILPSWGPFCPDVSSFCPLSMSGQKKGYFGVGLGMFCVRTYPRKGFASAE